MPIFSANIGFDTAWDHNRRGHFNILKYIEQKSHKIVDYVELHKGTTYSGSAQGKENTGFIMLVQKWKSNKKMKYFVHDKDVKSKKTITSSRWDIQEKI